MSVACYEKHVSNSNQVKNDIVFRVFLKFQTPTFFDFANKRKLVKRSKHDRHDMFHIELEDIA